MAIDKLLQYDSRPDETGEALVHPVSHSASGSLQKTASDVHPDVQKHLSEAEAPPEDMMRLLITALSSHDTFGPNKNGDGFYRQDLLHDVDYGENPAGEGSLVIPMFKSFEHFARPYKHHRNNESSPAYGQIEKAFFNPKMDRVELVTLLDTAKAPRVAEKIENYEPVSTSMGFRASYDTCSVCGNEASSRREYCDHLKNNMLDVRPDGHIVHARNPKGKFFDISFVGTPADGTSRAVHVGRLPTTDGKGLNEKNDATGPLEDEPGPTAKGEEENKPEDSQEANNQEANNQEDPKEARRSFAKAACMGWAGSQDVILSADIAAEVGLKGDEALSWRKEADQKEADEKPEEKSGKKSSIDKRVNGDVEEVGDLPPEKEKKVSDLVGRIRGTSPMIKKEVLDRISGYPLETVASTMTMAGVSLRPEEMQHLALTKAGAPGLSRTLWEKGRYLCPDTPGEKTANVGLVLGPRKVNDRLLEKMAGNRGLMEARSLRIGPLTERLKSPEKTAAAGMGANPYLRHREPITPEQARAMATQEEQDRLREYKPGETKHTSILEYLAHMLIGSEWNSGRVSDRQRRALRSSYRAPRRGQMQGERRPMAGGTMTMPMAHYIRGAGSQTPVYGQSGIAEQAMSKQSSLRKQAADHVQRVVRAMEGMDKVAAPQIEYVIGAPEKYDHCDVEAALLCRLDQSAS